MLEFHLWKVAATPKKLYSFFLLVGDLKFLFSSSLVLLDVNTMVSSPVASIFPIKCNVGAKVEFVKGYIDLFCLAVLEEGSDENFEVFCGCGLHKHIVHQLIYFEVAAIVLELLPITSSVA